MGRPIITLTTDFGSRFSYVAEMKGVILTHWMAMSSSSMSRMISSLNLSRRLSWSLRDSWRPFPLGTTHLVVVDPGVGTNRRPIAGAWRSHHFVGPDNGIFGRILNAEDAQAVELTKRHLFREPVSKTFHGRDIFAPVAAALAGGLTLSDVGHPRHGACVDDRYPGSTR